jgi:hypothetical protein
MGGKALKNVVTRRYLKDEYFNIKNILEQEISNCTKAKVSVVEAYRSKESFGDMDIVVEIIGNRNDTVKKIFDKIPYTEKVHNGNVVSFNYNDLQVDLILTPSDEFEFAKVFFAYNDLGLILGRMAKGIGLTYGFDGMSLKVYADNHIKLDKISLTKDPRSAFTVLGLNFDRWLLGFETLDEVFEFAASSKYFVLRIFENDFQNSENRRRDNKRENLHKLIAWINQDTSRFQYSNKKMSQSEIVEYCEIMFPNSNVLHKASDVWFKYNLSKRAHAIFNCNMIMEMFPELKGKELGKVFNEFQKFLEYTYNMKFKQICLIEGTSKMNNLFKEFYKNLILNI